VELTTNSGVVLVNSVEAPQLPLHAAVVEQLRASFSMPQQNLNPPRVAGHMRETSTSSHSGAINSTSTNTTVVVDIEDSGILDEPVFLETETKSDDLAKNGHLLNQPFRKCVSTSGCGSHECTKTLTTAGQHSCQKTTDSSTGNGVLNKQGINHRDPETVGSPSYVNITKQLQAPVHTTDQGRAMQYSLSQPLLSECNQSPTYVNHTEIPFCQCRICRTSDYSGCGYVNVPNQSSLSQPLLDDNDHGLHHVPVYVNQTQAHSSGELDHAIKSTASLSPFNRQTSAPTDAAQANEQVATGQRVHTDGDAPVQGYVNILNKGSEVIPPLEHQKSENGRPQVPAPSKSPSQLRSLPPRTQQPTTDHCESPHDQLTRSAHRNSDSGYEDASSLLPKTLQQTISTSTTTQAETVPSAGRSHSNKSCSTMTSDRGYVNVTKPRSISQPTPVTANMLNSFLIPPRTILRTDLCQPRASNSKSSNIRALPPRSRSKTTPHIHTLTPPNSSDHETVPPPLTLAVTLLPEEDLQLIQKSTEIETKSSSGCSSGSSVHLYATVQAEKRCTHEKSKMSSRSTCSDRGCSCEPIGDDSYVVDDLESFDDGKMTESVESLDIWPPVIPPQSEQMFLVADIKPQPESVVEKDLGGGGLQNDLTDSVTTNINMTKNTSYVKHNN
jgi:hypothetical protein